MQTEFDAYLAQRNEVLAADDDARFGSQPSLVEGHMLVVALVPHKHDGTLVQQGQAYWMPDDRVTANVHRGLVALPTHRPHDYWRAAGRLLGAERLGIARPLTDAPSAGALAILAGCGYDPGNAAHRLHTAINEHTKHASCFAVGGNTNPYCDLRQLDLVRDLGQVRDAFVQADVIHNHVAYLMVNNVGIRPRPDQLLVRHYHGSRPDGGTHIDAVLDTCRQAKLFGARLALVDEAHGLGLEMEWSPIPVAVNRYRTLRDKVRRTMNWTPLEGEPTWKRPLRIGHSPTDLALKGTRVLMDVVDDMQKAGIPVQLELIMGVSFRESLERKAMCDVFFDSFWLGMQGSGLEAGAMELPVIAGDAHAATLHEAHVGLVPWTFADSAQTLRTTLEMFAADAEARDCMARMTADFVREYHDYPAVARRYEHSLARWLGRTDILTDPC